MNRITASLFLLFAFYANAQEIRYISDELLVPVRSTPCNTCKIVHGGLKSGTKLTVIETNSEGWSHIRTPGGTEGWLPKQYLVEQQIASVRLAAAEKSLAQINVRNQELASALEQKESELESLQQQVAQLSAEKSGISEELASIRQISSNAVSIHEQNQELGKRNQLLKNEVDILTASNKQLKDDQIYNWFIYGALSVFLGALLSALLPRLKRKRRYSEWS